MASGPEAEHGPSEDAPLLSPSIRPVYSQAEASEPSREKPSQLLILTLLLLYVVFLDLGYELIVPAQTRVFEAIYCREYYEEHDPTLIGTDGRDGIDEKWCKVGLIQGEVAMLKGWQITFDSIGSAALSVPTGMFITQADNSIPVLAFSVPWGICADSYGRRPVILLLSIALWIKYAYVQLISYFGGTLPLRLTWLSAFHTCLGGSVSVATALIYTIISDVVPEGKRVTLFFQVVAANFTTQFLGPLLSAVLMGWSPWIPMILGLAVELIAVGLICFIPETLNYSGCLSPESECLSAESAICTKPIWIWRRLPRFAHDSISFLLSDARIVWILSAFVVHMLLLNRDILLQYISTRYQSSLALATGFVSIRSGLILLLCLIILPAANPYFRHRFGSKRSDLLLSRASAALMALSFLMIGLAPNRLLLVSALVINSMGWGLFSFLRSLAISLVEAHHVARLNTFIGVSDTAGLMIGSPLLAMLFRTGLELGGLWSGAPFLVSAGIVAIITLTLSGISIRR